MPFRFNPFTSNFDEVVDITGKVDKVTSTDNAVVRFNGTDGTVQNSGVLIDDSNNVIIPGDLTVNGTTTTINTTNLDVTDANITINNSGNDASAEGAGLAVERTGTNGSLVYEDALATKFKLGALGSEVEIVDISTAQTLTNKTIDADNNTITDIANANIAAAAAISVSKLEALTVNRAVQTGVSGFLEASTVTSTELGYLSGVTSPIQTQLNNIAVIFDVATTSGTASLTAGLAYIVNTSAGAASLTLPAPVADAFIRIKDNGNAEANNITVLPNAAETIDGASSAVIDSNYGSKVFVSDGTDWYIF